MGAVVQRKLVWTEGAREDRRRIFSYWTKRNKSDLYSRRLSKAFLRVGNGLLKNHYLGLRTSLKNIFYVVVEKKFLMLYRTKPEAIEIIAVWDGRRNPDDFEKLITKR